jgi:glycosyltransferase involved in cell wall biosynthesis
MSFPTADLNRFDRKCIEIALLFGYGKLADSDSGRLVAAKNPSLLSDLPVEAFYAKSLFKFFALFCESWLRTDSLIILLDYPFHSLNLVILIFFYLFKLSLSRPHAKIYMSVRGNLPVPGVHKRSLKLITYRILAFLGGHEGLHFICSSSYECHTFVSNVPFIAAAQVSVMPDILLSSSYFAPLIYSLPSSSLPFSTLSPADTLTATPVKILFPSRLSPEKGVIELLSLAKECLYSHYHTSVAFRLSFCCTEDALAVYLTKQQRLDLFDISFIDFLDWLSPEDFYKELSGHNIVVIPSMYESFSVACYQALLAGTNVIITEESPWLWISNAFPILPITLCPSRLGSTSAIQFILLLQKSLSNRSPSARFSLEQLNNMILAESLS